MKKWGWRTWLLIILFPIPYGPWWLTIICVMGFCLLAYLIVAADNSKKARQVPPVSRDKT
jgi:hypothetical protein